MASQDHFSLAACRPSRLATLGVVAAFVAVTVTTSAVTASGAAAAAPPGFGFALNAGDLRFILKQIKIAENHATKEGPDGQPVAGQALLGSGTYQIANPLLPFGLRTVDGTYNNLVADRQSFGAAHATFPRLTTPAFRDAEPAGPFGPPGPPTSYKQKSGVVVDSGPRQISNIIVDQTSANPAAVKAAKKPHRTFLGEPVEVCESLSPDLPAGCVPPGQTLPIPNVTTDVGLSPPFNGWFTLFGQFFDHGVDLTVKEGGAVVVPLKPGDPLIAGKDRELGTSDDLPPDRQFMVLTRAKNQPGPDGIMGTADDLQEATNVVSPWVDQSQTYTSHSSHQVFLREYQLNDAGRTVANGMMLRGPAHGMATWKTVKDQARDLLGIELSDADALNIPLLLTDQYGRYLRGPDRGLPQVVMSDGSAVEGNRAAPISTAGAKRITVAFLDDIAHTAVPKPGLAADPDTTVTPGAPPAGTYDNELLNEHFIAGDGRVNENIGLTAVHHVFHSEHNRLVDYLKSLITSQHIDEAEWHTITGEWNGERMFQAARFVTEMEYQHLVFEEFARKIQPHINPFNVFTQSDTAINPAITAEYAHAVYRFGHSMLTDTISRTKEDGTKDDVGLIDGFLNPLAFTDGHALSPEQAAGRIAMGMTDQVGNEIDEFVTETLRNNLLGLPLDLPTINMARAREAGIPSLNSLRKELYAQTQESSLKPYTDWVDFGQSLKHLDSVVNFMAAYGKHPTILSAPTIDEKRAAAQLLYDNDPALHPETPGDAYDFVNSAGSWASTGGTSQTGVDDVDLWVGGLAESQNLFGGLLGSTFNYVFERQLTDLQDGDRLYYLSRTSGLNLRTALEGNSFAELVMRNTTAHSLKSEVFSVADCEFELANLQGTGNTVADDPTSGCDESKRLIRMADGTIRYRQTNVEDPPGLNAQSTYNGTAAVDRIWGGVDNDTFWGNAGNDRIEGSDGADTALGGEGNDIITDSAGDDVHKGGDGNDAIDAGPGIDVIMSGNGSDFTNGGLNENETFAGEGNDFVTAGGGPDTVFGGGGDDWQEGGNGNDLLQGDSGAPFFDDINEPGHDVLIGGSNEDDYDAEGGDDIMVAGPGIERNHGVRGFDWATHAREATPADSDLTISIAAGPGQLADRFLLTEALSGWDRNDILRGDDLIPFERDVELRAPWGSNALTTEGIARIKGLGAIVAGNTECRTDPQLPDPEGEGGNAPPPSGPPVTICGFGKGNILLGGAGSDLIQGRGADDIIDGDAWLNHRLSVRTNPADPGTETQSANQLSELSSAVFGGELDPARIVIVREILTTGTDGVDTAVYSGPRADYDLDNNGATLTVFHARNLPPCCADQNGAIRGDGTDTLRNVERLQFSDQVVEVSNIPTNGPPTGTVTLSTSNPVENQPLTATRAFNDPDGVVDATVEFTWQALLNGTWTPVFTGASFTPTDNEVGSPLRVLATFTDGDGVLESVTSAATANVANVNDVPTGVPAVLDLTPQEGVAVSVSTSLIADGDGLPGTLNVAWQASTTPTGNTFAAIPGATSASFTPAQAQVNRRLRVRVTFVDAHGTSESVVSAPTGVVGDMFVGTSGADTWTGTAGDDRAFGGGGADNLNAGNGDDVLAGEAGNDLINAGGGNDTIQFTGTSGGFDSVTGGAGSDAVVATVADTHIGLTALTSTELVSAEALVGSGVSPGVRVVGSAGNETITFAGVTMTGIVDIDGAAGNDTLTGTPSADVLLGSDGTDTLTTNGGNDIANGGAGTDTISTGAGDDQATGGAGDDAITPGTGNDLVRYETGVFGADTITGFDANPAGGQDLVDLSDRGITTATFGATVSIGPAPAGGTLITISGNTIRLVGVAPTTVTASDFRLAAP